MNGNLYVELASRDLIDWVDKWKETCTPGELIGLFEVCKFMILSGEIAAPAGPEDDDDRG